MGPVSGPGSQLFVLHPRSPSSDLSSQIGAVRPHLSDLGSQISGSQISALSVQISVLRFVSGLKFMNSQLLGLRSQLADLRSQLTDLRTQFSDLRSSSIFFRFFDLDEENSTTFLLHPFLLLFLLGGAGSC